MGQTVRRFRLERRLSQMELSRRTGLSNATISAIETGAVAASTPEILERIEDGLGVERGTLIALRRPRPVRRARPRRVGYRKLKIRAITHRVLVGSMPRVNRDALSNARLGTTDDMIPCAVLVEMGAEEGAMVLFDLDDWRRFASALNRRLWRASNRLIG